MMESPFQSFLVLGIVECQHLDCIIIVSSSIYLHRGVSSAMDNQSEWKKQRASHVHYIHLHENTVGKGIYPYLHSPAMG